MTRSRNKHTSSLLYGEKHKKARRSVAFISPIKARYFRHHERSFDDDTDDDNCADNDDDTEHSDSESFFLWDEESTLLDVLMDKPKDQLDVDPSVLALSESLRDALVDRGQASKSEMAHIFVSTNAEVKNCFKVLDEKLEPTMGKEIIKFNVVCKQGERMCLRLSEIAQKVEAHNAECNRLEQQIAANFAERDALYAQFEEFAQNTLTPVLERLNGLPGKNERWMTQMDEDLNAIDKKYNKLAASKELQGYLGFG